MELLHALRHICLICTKVTSKNKENFMDIFDEFWRGYFTRKPNQMEKKTAIDAVMKAFMLDTTIDPAMRKELVSELIPEVLGNGAGILFWAGTKYF